MKGTKGRRKLVRNKVGSGRRRFSVRRFDAPGSAEEAGIRRRKKSWKREKETQRRKKQKETRRRSKSGRGEERDLRPARC